MSSFCGLVSLACLSTTPVGYLPRLGPVPIRHQAVLRPAVPPVKLPPLIMKDEVPSTGPSSSDAATGPAAFGTTNGTASAVSPALVPLGANGPLTHLDTNEVPEVTPLLLPYFLQRFGPGNAGTVVQPFGFTPATPTVAPASSASYSSPPTGP